MNQVKLIYKWYSLSAESPGPSTQMNWSMYELQYVEGIVLFSYNNALETLLKVAIVTVMIYASEDTAECVR